VPSLKDIARRANVSIRTTFQVLNGTSTVSKATQRRVLAAARDLHYKLNVTLRDVADEANVSITTVSYVLHDNPEIGPATRARVLEAIQALDYRVNKTARNLKTQRTHMIGYPWHITEDPDRFSPMLDRFLYSVALTAESYGYHVLTFTEPASDVSRIYKELILGRSVDGFILAEPRPDDPRINLLEQMKIPFVVFGRSGRNMQCAYVDVDAQLAIARVVEHLIELGHRNIAFLGLGEQLTTAESRMRGFFNTLADAGLKPRPEWMVRVPNTRHAAAKATQQIMEANPALTALVCSSDVLALGANAYLESVGLRMGVDIAVTGFDDEPIAAHLELTSIRQPTDVIGATAANLLLSQIKREELPMRQILLEAQLVVRSSSQVKVVDGVVVKR
jgi:DNA-binding LacI/PurR family transcriptional regulator